MARVGPVVKVDEQGRGREEDGANGPPGGQVAATGSPGPSSD